MVYLFGEEASWPSTPPLFPPSPARLHPDNTEDNTLARHSGMREGPKNGPTQNLSSQVAAAWSFLELKLEAVGAQKLQGSSANSPMPEPARAQNPCVKPSRLPASAYAGTKMAHLQTAEMCRSHGVQFTPLVAETTAAWEPHSAAFLKRVARAVAAREGASAALLEAQLLQELCITARSFHARTVLHRRAELSTATS